MGRERETRRRRDEDEDVGAPKKKRKVGRSRKNPPSQTIQQAPPSPHRPANPQVNIPELQNMDGDYVGFDWRNIKKNEQPVLSPVKNQEGLLICWAISTLDVIETIHKIRTGNGIQLSRQYLIDFVWPIQNFNTGRGYNVNDTLDHIIKEGVAFERAHKFAGCRQNEPKPEFEEEDLFRIKGYGTVKQMADISRMLRDRPLIIRYKFDRSFINKKDWSIYIPETDAVLAYPHGSVLVGEGTQIKDGVHYNYWIIKNSWGDKWGERGFGRIIKDLKIEAWYPILSNDKLPPD